jgi:hypothetical protein
MVRLSLVSARQEGSNFGLVYVAAILNETSIRVCLVSNMTASIRCARTEILPGNPGRVRTYQSGGSL